MRRRWARRHTASFPGVYVNREHALQSLNGQSRKAKREKKRLTLDIPGDPYLLSRDAAYPRQVFPSRDGRRNEH